MKVQVFSMYSQQSNINICYVSGSSLSGPESVVFLKQTVNRTFCLLILCWFVCISECNSLFAPAFLFTAKQNHFHHRQQHCLCPQQFGSQQVKQKKKAFFRLILGHTAKPKKDRGKNGERQEIAENETRKD